MLKLSKAKKFVRDVKRCIKRGYDISELENIVNILRIPYPLPIKNRDHPLIGNHIGERECHIAPDWILVYRITDDELLLLRTGTHADILGL